MKMTKIFLAFIAMFAISCTQENGGGTNNDTAWTNEGSIIGEWELTSFDGSSEAKPRIYLDLNEDGTFDMYQQAYSVVWLHYTGIFQYDGTTLSGTYSDGEAWSSEYTATFAAEPKRMRLISKKSSADISIYIENEIPATIVDEAREPEKVRSVTIKPFL